MIYQGELGNIAKLAAEVLQPGHFFIGPGMDLLCEHMPYEEIAWEVARGRLVPSRYARQLKGFSSWNVYHVHDRRRSAAPILSIKLDAAARQVHVVRAILSHVWEAVDAGNNIIDSREVTAWVPELVGTINLDEFLQASEAELQAEISHLVAAAVVGTSRLPLTSLESPLPGFSLGHLAFVGHRAGAGAPLRSGRELIELLKERTEAGCPQGELARVLEVALRATETAALPDFARLFCDRCRVPGLPPHAVFEWLRTLFNDVSLSPWTSLVDNVLSFTRQLVVQGQVDVALEIDFLGHLLRQLGRHLTAYDLSTYHHRGANYPDALLLDACLKRLLGLCEMHADLFLADGIKARLRRRALRVGWCLRVHYTGHYVPDAPTSPGENVRVLPPPFVRVPEEQLLHPGKRRRQLYDGDPIAAYLGAHGRTILRQGLRDLDIAGELRELGLAVFIDRPLGARKAPGEPDLTPLLSYLAFSRSMAARRLRELDEHCRSLDLALPVADLQARLAALPIRGKSLDDAQPPARGIVSLADVRRVAEDFELLETLPAGVRQFVNAFDWLPVAPYLDVARAFDKPLIVPVRASSSGELRLAVYDAALEKSLDLIADLSDGYQVYRGVETPRAGLVVHHAGRVLRVRAAIRK